MAYDEDLANRIREVLAQQPGVDEKADVRRVGVFSSVGIWPSRPVARAGLNGAGGASGHRRSY